MYIYLLIAPSKERDKVRGDYLRFRLSLIFVCPYFHLTTVHSIKEFKDKQLINFGQI